MNILWNDFISALATLGAAFAGSGSAFYLQNQKEKRKEKNRQISAINQALFALIRQYQALVNIQNDLEPFREDELRYLSAPAISANDYYDYKIKVEMLDFLLDSSEPNLLMQILLEVERFEMALKSIQLRTNDHIEKLQPQMEKHGIAPGALISLDDLNSKIGFLIRETLTNETNQMYKHVDETIQSTLIGIKDLEAFARRTYPKTKFVRLEGMDG